MRVSINAVSWQRGQHAADTSMRRNPLKLRGLRQARQRSGLSISQLAELTSLRRDTVTHLEHGKEDAQPYVLRRLAAALGASTAELVGVSVLEAPATDPSRPPTTSGSSEPVYTRPA